jgi:acyl-CoA synthetase (AMP-forming)/AMP-acid ligase II
VLSGPPLPELRAATVGAALQAAAADAARAARAGLVFVGLDESEQSFSWSEILTRAQHAASVLRARGVRPGDRVALSLPTGPLFCDALFGALLLGGGAGPALPAGAPRSPRRVPAGHRPHARGLRGPAPRQ